MDNKRLLLLRKRGISLLVVGMFLAWAAGAFSIPWLVVLAMLPIAVGVAALSVTMTEYSIARFSLLMPLFMGAAFIIYNAF